MTLEPLCGKTLYQCNALINIFAHMLCSVPKVHQGVQKVKFHQLRRYLVVQLNLRFYSVTWCRTSFSPSQSSYHSLRSGLIMMPYNAISNDGVILVHNIQLEACSITWTTYCPSETGNCYFLDPNVGCIGLDRFTQMTWYLGWVA